MSSKYKISGAMIVLFHLVGAAGTIIPAYRQFIIAFTPFHLLLSAAFLFYGHQGSYFRLGVFFLVTSLAGYAIEVIGVKTGFPFGDYWYGDTLGWKVADVPVVIGVNWFLLTYSFGMLAASLAIPEVLKPFAAATGMVALDMLIEPVAICLDYWHWHGKIPLTNFLGWFAVALVLLHFFKKMKFYETNPLTKPLLASQVIYFGSNLFSQMFF